MWFWYGLRAVDFVVCLALLTRPRIGLTLAVATESAAASDILIAPRG